MCSWIPKPKLPVSLVSLSQLIFFNLETTLQDFLGFSSSDCAMTSNFFITLDSKRAHGIPCLGGDRLLTGQLFQHLGSTRQPITRLANTNIQTKLENPQLTH